MYWEANKIIGGGIWLFLCWWKGDDSIHWFFPTYTFFFSYCGALFLFCFEYKAVCRPTFFFKELVKEKQTQLFYDSVYIETMEYYIFTLKHRDCLLFIVTGFFFLTTVWFKWRINKSSFVWYRFFTRSSWHFDKESLRIVRFVQFFTIFVCLSSFVFFL